MSEQSINNSRQETINWEKVEHYLRSEMPDLPKANMKVKQFSEGYSNLTYLLRIGDWEAVLRRPPFGYVPPKAHDMKREHRILTKVHPVFPLAPKPYFYCDDPEVMDKHFYVMEKKEGVVVDDELPAEYKDKENAGQLISTNVIHTLASLQSIDYKEADLQDLGKPKGYLERQVHGWIKRYERADTEDKPQVKDLEQWLIDHLPPERETTIVHNDFKLNNMVLDAADPGKTQGILDWELSTIGDPFTDLGSTIAYWAESDDPDIGISRVTDQSGFYSRREFLEEYANISGRDLSDIHYYTAFGFYKLAGILQQLYHRWKIGEIEDSRFSTLNTSIANLLEMAEQARRRRIV
ncbi:phosphotransferase family protein [Alteribacillus sp. YIM 98480]|uniref:phosphotransferase family protein n=1 Tax=Alteribacillus sp. YIM 98480 TaxID=2606599 RepID=UPI001E48652F|nr:phosphotransferase family protein [Alteribacillus sp. YIM 98480]